MLSLNPLFPIPVFILIFVLSTSYFYWSHKRVQAKNQAHRQALMLKVLALFLLMTFGLRPELEYKELRYHKDQLLIVTDISDSMTIEDMPSGISRKSYTNELFIENTSLLNDLEEKFNIQKIYFGKNTSLIDKDVITGSTSLSKSLISSIRQKKSEAIKGLILISDGQANHGLSIDNAIKEFQRKKIPIHTLTLGRNNYGHAILDGKLEELSCPSKAKRKETLKVEIDASLKGEADMNTKIEVYIDKVKVAEQNYTHGEKVSLEIPVDQFSIGYHELNAKINCGDKEITPLNNTQTTYFEVQEGGTRILLIATSPSADFKFLSRYLKTTNNLDPIIPSPFFYRTAEGQQSLKDLKAETLDLIIFQNPDLSLIPHEFLDKCDRLFKSRKQGIVFQGPKTLDTFRQHRQLLDYLPVHTNKQSKKVEGSSFKLSQEGKIHFITKPLSHIEQFEINGLSRAIDDPLFSKTLLSYGEAPLLVVSNYQSCKTAWLNTNSLWQMNTESESEKIYNSIWQRLILSLTSREEKPKTQLSLLADRSRCITDEDIKLTTHLVDKNGESIVHLPINLSTFLEGELIHEEIIPPGQTFQSLTFTKQGLYSIRASCTLNDQLLTSNELKIYAKDQQLEFNEILANKKMMQKIAQITKGRSLNDKGDFNTLLTDLFINSTLHTSHKVISKKSLWDTKFTYIILCLILSLEWYRRRKLSTL